MIHYDIKSSNILLDTLSKHVTAKIADVGLSRVLQATLATLTDGHFMRGCGPRGTAGAGHAAMQGVSMP